jgi:hypothetical protein
MDALVLMVKLNCAGLSGRPVIRPRPFSGSQVSYSRQRAITEARRDVPTTQKAAAKSHDLAIEKTTIPHVIKSHAIE